VLHLLRKIGLVPDAVNPGTIGDILKDGFGEGIGLLKYHADTAAKGDHIHVRVVDVSIVEQHLSSCARIRDEVVHPVQAAQERALPTSRWPDKGRCLMFIELQGDILERKKVSVVKIEMVRSYLQLVFHKKHHNQ